MLPPLSIFLFWLYAFLQTYIHLVLNTVNSTSIAWPHYLLQLINHLFENNTILILLSIQSCSTKIREDKRVNTNIVKCLQSIQLGSSNIYSYTGQLQMKYILLIHSEQTAKVILASMKMEAFLLHHRYSYEFHW